MRGGLVTAVMAIAALVTAAPASAACWSASAPVSGGDWNTPGNWVGDAVPGPTETAVFTEQGGGCGVPQDVVVGGSDTDVGLIRQANTEVIVDGTKLTIKGISTLGADLLGNVHVRNGGTLAVDVGADVTIGGQIKLGNPNGGSLVLDGTLRVLAGLTVTDEPAGGGALAISATGKLLYNPGNSGEIHSQVDNDGAIELAANQSGSSQLLVYPAASVTSSGSFTIGGGATLALRPTRGTTMIAGGSIAGPGRLRIDESVGPAAPGTVQVPGAGSLVVGELWIGEPSALDLQTGGTTGQLAMSGAGLRLGSGTLTATNAALTGGVLRGGVTKITGTASINGDAANPTLRGGATLRTQGTTTWSGGAVTLGAPGESGTWENAGTLNADNANTGAGKPDLKLVAGDPSGVLRNLGGATLNRGAPAGVLGGAGRIENAGTVNVSAGTLGEPAPGSSGAYLQTAGVTTVAAGATLSMNATLDGGQLRGNGTVRKVINAKGVVAPGSSPGMLTVSGDYAQGPLGTLAAEVAGPLSSQFDRLLVGGAATLAGTLAISADGGYTPAPQSKHEILTASSLGGTFTTVTGAQTAGSSFVADYGPDALRLCFAGCTPGELGNMLEVTLSGAGTGTVTSDSGGIACAPACAHAFAPGATVKLTANAAPGSVFVGWSDPCSGTGTCELAMSAAQAVTASFSIQPQAPAVPETPAVAPAPAKPSTPAKLVRLSASSVISMPSSKSCVRKARLSVRIRVPAGLTGRRATAVIRGRQRAAVTGAAMKKPFTVRTPAKGPFTLKVTVTVADGRSVSASARYRAC